MKVEEIRPEALMAGQQAAMLRDVALLLDRRGEFVEVDCPACAAAQRDFLYEKYGLRHMRCAACRTQYVSPRPPPPVLEEFYRRSENYRYFAEHIFPASEDARRERLFRPRAETVGQIAERLGLGSASLLEVGAGYGTFCEEIARLGRFRRIVGIEPTPDLAQICRRKGIEVIEAPVETVRPDEPFDVLAAFEVIEHLFDPSAFLVACRRLVRPGGWILLTCPNILGLDTIVLGRESSAVDHEHLNYFHPASMTKLLESAGFDRIEVTTPGRLDLDLLRRARAAGAVAPAQLGPFLDYLAAEPDDARDAAFRHFLQEARLSSSMQALARRA